MQQVGEALTPERRAQIEALLASRLEDHEDLCPSSLSLDDCLNGECEDASAIRDLLAALSAAEREREAATALLTACDVDHHDNYCRTCNEQRPCRVGDAADALRAHREPPAPDAGREET